MMFHFLIVEWYSVLRVVLCLWYICFTCFCGILWHDVLLITLLHYLILFANKFRTVIVPCNIEANSNAYPKILIFSCEWCCKQILLLRNYQFWLVLVSLDDPMLLMCFLLLFPSRHCGRLRRLLILLLILRHVVVFCIQRILHHP